MQLPGRSLVIVRDSGPYLLHLNPFSENAPDLDGKVLYSVDRGADSFELLERYPERTPYVQRTNHPLLSNPIKHTDAKVPTVSVLPITVIEGPAVQLKVQVRNPTNEAAVVATLSIGNRVEQRTLSPSPDGTYETEWTLVPASVGRRSRRCGTGDRQGLVLDQYARRRRPRCKPPAVASYASSSRTACTTAPSRCSTHPEVRRVPRSGTYRPARCRPPLEAPRRRHGLTSVSSFVRRDLRVAAVPWVIGRLLVVGALALSRDLFDQIGAPPRPVALGQGLFAWDAAFYRDIAEHGYAAVGEASLRFFPLVPMLARAARVVVLRPHRGWR